MRILAIFLWIFTIWGWIQTREVGPQDPEKNNRYWFWAADWHPANDQVALGGTQDTLRILSTKSFRLLKNYPYKGTITQTKWHPAKNKLAVSVQDGISKPSILNLDTDNRILLDSISGDGARALGWNHSGNILAVGDYDGYLTLFDENGNFLKKINTNQKGIIGLDWHPGEDLIVAVGEKITLYHFQTDRLTNIEDRKEDILMLCVEWNPDGRFFVTGDYGDFEYHHPPLLQYWSYDGRKIKSIEKSKAEYRNMSWSGDGDLLATASEKIRLWNKNGEPVAEKTTDNLLWGIDWNGDASKLVVTDDKGKIIFWDRNRDTLFELQSNSYNP
jgi:WD40 repeat protein